MFKEDGMPPYIKVSLPEQLNSSNTFADNSKGAVEAAAWVTKVLGRDDWRMEDMAFLGYRIVVPADKKEEERTPVLDEPCHCNMPGEHYDSAHGEVVGWDEKYYWVRPIRKDECKV